MRKDLNSTVAVNVLDKIESVLYNMQIIGRRLLCGNKQLNVCDVTVVPWSTQQSLATRRSSALPAVL
jgi:hypothetical protein